MTIKTADFEMEGVFEKTYKQEYIDCEDFKAYVGLINIIRSENAIKIEATNTELAASGYQWLVFYPADDSKIALTVCYDNHMNVIEWYFDIINSSGVNNGMPYIEDLYLDVVLEPDGTTKMLDEDELEDALNDNIITKEQFDMAYMEANKLIEKIKGKQKELTEFCKYYLEKLNLIGTITDETIGEKSIEFETKRLRFGARGIIYKEDGTIALFNKVNMNEYKLPGGGIEEGEIPEEAFIREAMEETGCKVEIEKFIGTIGEIKSHDNFRQTSYIYVAKVIENTGKLDITEKEKEAGATLVWKTPEEALELVSGCFDKLVAKTEISLYHTKFEVKRDEKILKKYLNKE